MKISEPFLSGYRIHVSLDLHYYSNVSIRHQGLLLCFWLLGRFIAWPNLSLDSVLGCWTMFILAANQTFFLFGPGGSGFESAQLSRVALLPIMGQCLCFVTTNYIMTCYISKCIWTWGKIKPINNSDSGIPETIWKTEMKWTHWFSSFFTHKSQEKNKL